MFYSEIEYAQITVIYLFMYIHDKYYIHIKYESRNGHVRLT